MVSKNIAIGLLLLLCLAISQTPAEASLLPIKPPPKPIKPPLPPPPPAVSIILSRPRDGEKIPSKYVVLEWDNANACNNPIYEIWIESSEGDDNWSLVMLENTGENKIVMAELPDGLYRWGVEVYQAGVITGWSNESYFSVDTVPALVGNINVSATANSATISWKTDKASTTLLEFGMNNEFGSTVKDMNVTTDHSVTIFGLSPITKYCFRIKSVGINGIENIFPASEFITRPEITPALEYTKIPGEKVSLLKNTQITINVLHSTVSKLVLISSEDLYDVKFFIEDSAIPIDPSYVQLFQYDIKISPKVVGSIEFKIETERIRMYNIEEVYVLHYANGSWNRLNACFIKSDGPYCYFSAYTDSFSPFAIVGTIAERPLLEKNVPTTFPHVEDSDEDIAWMMTTIGGLGAIIILTMVLLKPYILRMEKRTNNRSANPKRKDKI